MSFVATLLLWAVTLSGFAAVFADRAWVPVVAAAALIPLSIEYSVALIQRSSGLRTQRVARAVAILAHVLGFLLLIGWVAYPDTLFAGIPTRATLQALAAGFDTGAALLRETVAPTGTQMPLVVMAAATVWLAAAASGAATWSVGTPALGIVLPLTLFTFAHVFAQSKPSLVGIGLFLVIAVAVVIAADYERSGVRWRHAAAPVTIFSVVVVAGALLAPQLPGWGAPAILDYKNTVGTRVSDNPLVDILPRLVDQSDRPVFEVHGREKSYWRLTSLDEFDGRVWKRSGRAPELPSSTNSEEAVYRVAILELSSPWLPVAPYPTTPSQRTEIEPGTASLVVPGRTRNGTTYEVASTPISPSAAELGAVGFLSAAGDDVGHYLVVPELSERVRDWADEVTAGAGSPYEAALAIQEELRTYTYSLEVEPGHSARSLEEFLWETRTGYCEQFASAMAVLARARGIPSRVAVGYLPGVYTLADQTVHVRGKDSHAWPELYFDGIGWLAFEPTPSRGDLEAAYLPDSADETSPPETAPPATTAEPAPAGQQAPTTIASSPPPTTGTAPRGDDRTGSWSRLLVVILAILAPVAIVAAALGAPPALKALRRARRRRRGVAGLWAELRDVTRDLGIDVSRGATPLEVARRCRAAGFDVDAVADRLVVAGFDPDSGPQAEQAAWDCYRAAWVGYASRHRRQAVRAALSLRSLRPGGARRPQGETPTITRVALQETADDQAKAGSH